MNHSSTTTYSLVSKYLISSLLLIASTSTAFVTNRLTQTFTIAMSLDNPNGGPSDTQLYGDDSLFADFDPDEFVARHRSQMQPSQPHVESFQPVRKRDWIPDADDDETRAGPSLKRSHIVSSVPPDDATVTTTATLITETQSQAMHKTLFDYFGHSSFRTGQLEIISSIVFGRKDAAFFCPTGKGKSLCYQLPPLFMGKIAIIISPLISLMQDQVFKMNSLSVRSTSHRRLATFLGSGQTDSNAETQALQGHYSLVYCTPEKLSGHSFLQALADLHLRNDSNNICLFAIDESHCVSEWGHDFRPHYRTIGQTLRSHPVLRNIPILALTATAVPRVQRDILSNLYFRPGQSHIVSQTIDRPNLSIHICRKPQGGFKVALSSLVQELTSLTDKKSQLAFGSTIIYAPTQNLVDEICHWLQSTLLPQTTHPWVLPYHAGLSLQHRSEAHTNFLVDKTKVIVATVAFGMGIDKPDIRRIIHFGAPGTMEDYYQQIGRCGRDGLESSCTLFCNEADFTAYKSSFYVGALPSHVRTFREESINAFRNFCMNDESCRRAKLLEYFVQPVTFEGGRCGTCDTCKTRSQHASDLKRDFADDGARLVLYAISVLKDKSSLTWIENILNGKMVESFRYRSGAIVPQVVQEKIISMKAACTKGRRWPISHFTKGFLPSLVNGGYVQKCDMSSQMSGMKYTNTWVGYDLTVKGRSVLETGPIVLPVPAFIREVELKEQAKNRSRIALLENAGVDMAQIPSHELENGDGEVMRSLETWHRYLENLENRGKSEFVNSLDDLRMRLDSWRSDMALQFQIAPRVVMAEHILFSVAYITATLPIHVKVEQDALVATGLRIGNIQSLIEILDQWRAETFTVTENNDDKKNDTPIPLPDDPFQPSKPWQWSEYKPNKKTGLPVWEISYNRFMAGENPQTIAMTQTSGRPIQVATVASHLLTALTNGRSVPLRRVAEVLELPTITEWKLLTLCEETTQINVCDDPKSCGVNGSGFSMKDFLVPILGNSFALKEYSERTEEEQKQFTKLCNLLHWYLALRRVGYTCNGE